MNGLRSMVTRALAAGTVATVTMDAAMAAGAVASPETFSSDLLGIGVIGRWAGGLLHGRWRTPAGSGRTRTRDVALGMVTHYATGIVLTEMYRMGLRATGRRSSLRSATLYGIATAGFPLFVLYPSLGYGCLGLRSGQAPRLIRIMLLGHVAFGFGIGIALTCLETVERSETCAPDGMRRFGIGMASGCRRGSVRMPA